jgi:glycosyltransferase involved in cell wall biosynthesis
MAVKNRILIFSTAYLPFIGGAEIAVKEITDRLPGYDFDLITARLDRKLPKTEKIGKVMIYRIGWGFSLDKFILAFLGHRLAGKLHRKNNYTAVWSIMASYGSLTAVKFKKRYKTVPFILTLQEGDDLVEVEKKAKILGSWWKNIFIMADTIQCISTYLAAWAIQLGASGQIEVIPNGVDLQRFNFRLSSVGDTKKLQIVTASRLVKKNGLDLMIRALPLLPETVVFNIAGGGEEEKSLRQLAKENNVSQRVIFHGLLAHDKLAAFLTAGDIFIRPSRSEGLGNSFLEAMAVGLPVVAPLVGGITDFLEDKKTGFVIEPESPESIAQVISYVSDSKNESEVEQITKKARQLVEGEYNWDSIVGKINYLLRN